MSEKRKKIKRKHIQINVLWIPDSKYSTYGFKSQLSGRVYVFPPAKFKIPPGLKIGDEVILELVVEDSIDC